jgi:hypothetical protein
MNKNVLQVKIAETGVYRHSTPVSANVARLKILCLLV